MDRNFWDEAKLNRLKISFDISLIFTLFGPFLIAAATGKLFLFPILLLIGIGSCFWFSFQAEEFLLEERKRRRERWAELDSSERERVLARRRQASRGYTEQDLWLARQYQARRDCAPFRDYAEQDLYFAQQQRGGRQRSQPRSEGYFTAERESDWDGGCSYDDYRDYGFGYGEYRAFNDYYGSSGGGGNCGSGDYHDHDWEDRDEY